MSIRDPYREPVWKHLMVFLTYGWVIHGARTGVPYENT